jgi:predicted kinase
MNKLTEFLTKPFIEADILTEGARDPGIFKAIFLAGGPGSGKSYVASKLFGIPENVNVSRTGLKMVNQDSELEMLMKKYFQTTDLDVMPDELFQDLTGVDRNGNPVDYATSGLRNFAKSLSKERLRLYTQGRLGVIIDGTGHKYKSVKAQKKQLEALGYDTYMVFVNTSLDVALERNEQRTRVVPEPIVRTSWQDVQNNLAFFQGLFGGSNFLIVDNNRYLDAEQAKKRFKMLVNKGITKFLSRPVSSKIGKDWLAKEKKFHKVFKDPGQSRFFESIDVPVEIGDTVKMGKFKNKKVVVKSIDWNEKGDLLINGRPALKFRLVKKVNAFDEEFGAPAGMLPSPSRKGINKNKTDKKSGYKEIDECITFANKFGNDIVLGKNRDRNYSPNLLVVRELTGYGTEICYVMDKDTDWCEGMNSYGIGIVNSALFVKRDEKEFDKTKKIKAPSKDGARIREALGYKKLSDVVRSLVTFHDGIKGHTIVSDGKKVAVIENTSRVKPHVTVHDLKKPLVRTNHGIKHPEQGYTRGPDRISSETRMKYAQELVKSTKNYKEVFPKFYNHTQKLGPKYDMVRSQNQLWTSSQLLVNLNKLNMMLYLIPGKVHFKGIINKLPEGYKPKISLEVRQYEHSPDDKYDTFVTTDKVKKPDIIDKKIKIKETLDLYMQKVVYSIAESGDSASNLKDVNEKLSRKDQIKQNKLRDERQKLIKKAIGFGSGANSHKLKLQIKDIEKQIAKLNEAKQIKKVIGVFGGRFQPFHSGHAATYDWLKGRVDEAYITTSNIKQPPRHPMNFSEKVRHMTKMGIPRNRIIQETSPYVAKNLLRKYDPETTAVVYVVGGKDSGRLGGKYFKPYTKDMKGFDEHGYILTAPQSGNISGTKARELLGDPKIDDSERQKRFKNIFGYFDKGNFQMMTNKFKKLFETYTLTDELIEEFLLEATGTPGGNLDDGPSTYYKDFEDYEKSSKNWIDNLYSGAGWKIIDYIVSNNAIDPMDNDDAPSEFSRRKPGKKHYVSTDVTHLDAGQAKGSVAAVGEYKKWMTDVVKPLGWEIVNWMGTDAAIDNIIGDLMVAGADGFSYEVKDKDNFHEQINSKSVLTQKNKGKGLLLMGGAYGHLNHPFDNNNLTFSDFRTLIINTLQGNLSNDGTVTEKTDGQNIMISWKNGKLIAARNGGHIKNFGAAALSISGVKSMFAGRGDLEKAFVGAMVDLSKAIGGLSDKQKDKIFAEGKKFMSLEIIYPKTANVIPYDKSLLQFHGTIEYNAAGSPIGSDSSSARVLAGMIKQINQNVQKTFSVTGPFVAKLPKVKNFSQRQSYFLGKLNALQNNYALRGTDTLADYHQAYWMEYILNGANQTDFMNITNDILVKLTKRWAFFDKSYKIPQIKKDLKEDHPKFLEWVLSTDKNDHARLQKEHIRDWEVLFFELGAEILKNLSDFIAANPDAAVQKIKKDLISVISKVKNSTDPKVLNTLKTQLDRLNAIGGLDAVVPSEGITFMFKGKLYKYTGAFAPVNQILGMLKFTR